ncbi:MAG: hypothetical protein ACR2PJ_03575 [Pseudomonadales bacterium]
MKNLITVCASLALMLPVGILSGCSPICRDDLIPMVMNEDGATRCLRPHQVEELYENQRQ